MARLSSSNQATEKAPEPAPKEKKKRGRPSLGDKRGAKPSAAPSKGGPQGRGKARTSDGAADISGGATSSKRPRTKNTKQTDEAEDAGPRKRQRRSLQDVAPPNSQMSADKGGKLGKPQKKPGRPAKPNAAPEQSSQRVEKPKSKRIQEAPARAETPRADAASQDETVDDGPPSPERPYLHIAPHVRHIKQSTIDAKWEALPAPGVATIFSVLRLSHRPVLQRMSGTAQRREHTSSALRMVTQRIARKVQRGMPFPPLAAVRNSSSRRADDGVSNSELEFEAVLDGKAALERQLEPALHAVRLLEREKARMEKELERDYEALKELEGRARRQNRERRERLKKAHVLTPGEINEEDEDEEKEYIFGKDAGAGNAFKVNHSHCP